MARRLKPAALTEQRETLTAVGFSPRASLEVVRNRRPLLDRRKPTD